MRFLDGPGFGFFMGFFVLLIIAAASIITLLVILIKKIRNKRKNKE